MSQSREATSFKIVAVVANEKPILGLRAAPMSPSFSNCRWLCQLTVSDPDTIDGSAFLISQRRQLMMDNAEQSQEIAAGQRLFASPVWLVGILALLLGGMMAPLPDTTLTDALFNMAHAPAFAIVAVMCMQVVQAHRFTRIAWLGIATLVWIALVGLGAATEWIQTLVGRHASWSDLESDACGALAGLIFSTIFTASRSQTRLRSLLRRMVAVVVGVGLIAYGSREPLAELVDMVCLRFQGDTLASFETPWELRRWGRNLSQYSRSTDHATDGKYSLRVELSPGRFPGLAMTRLKSNWSGHEQLVLDLTVIDKLDLIIKVIDADWNESPLDWFDWGRRLPPGQHEIRINLADIASAPVEREMRLDQIKTLQFFTINLEQRQVFYIDHIRLE